MSEFFRKLAIPMQINNIILTEYSTHNEQKCLKLIFDYDTESIQYFKKIPGRRWSQTMNAWYLPADCPSFTSQLLEQGTDIRFIRELFGYANIKTTVLYTKVAQTAVRKIKNPLDNLLNKKDNNAPP